MTTNNERASRLDRAARYLTVAGLLSISNADAHTIADLAIDFDTADDVINAAAISVPMPLAALDALLAYAQASYTSDDDYDDFRHELRVLLGPPFLDDIDANWDEND